MFSDNTKAQSNDLQHNKNEEVDASDEVYDKFAKGLIYKAITVLNYLNNFIS